MNEAELLFSEVLKYDRVSLYQNPGLKLSRRESEIISGALKRRINGEPIQYILGKTEFMGLEFKLDRSVLIPRQETEILVETAIKYATETQRHQDTRPNILDMGTGSGCIAISLARFLKDIKISATDISPEALEIAHQNALLNDAEIDFLQSDLFSNYELRIKNYELIVSNPPYIPSAEIKTLQLEIQFEPRNALDGGKDGLDFYRRIIKESPRYLAKKGYLVLEMGYNQSDSIENIFHNSGDFEIIEIVKDYNNIDRVIVAKKDNK